MARRKRRDADAVNERLDQETDETPDEAAEDDAALDDDLDDDDLESRDDPDRDDDLEDEAEPASRRGGTAVKRARADADAKAKADTKAKAAGREKERPRRERGGLIGRLVRFIREVFAELRKVIWPTRKELITYTTVVVVFVAAMLAIIAVLDYGFAKAMLWVFGGNTTEE